MAAGVGPDRCGPTNAVEDAGEDASRPPPNPGPPLLLPEKPGCPFGCGPPPRRPPPPPPGPPRPPPNPRVPRTSILLRSIATSPSASATRSLVSDRSVAAWAMATCAAPACAAVGLADVAGVAVFDAAVFDVPAWAVSVAAGAEMSIRCSTRSLSCAVTSSIRCVSSPASSSASWLAACRRPWRCSCRCTA